MIEALILKTIVLAVVTMPVLASVALAKEANDPYPEHQGRLRDPDFGRLRKRGVPCGMRDATGGME